MCRWLWSVREAYALGLVRATRCLGIEAAPMDPP